MKSNVLRAFTITTKNATLGFDRYVVLAHTFAEAEDIYWKELSGYYEIVSIIFCQLIIIEDMQMVQPSRKP